jgi:hypothetical protein
MRSLAKWQEKHGEGDDFTGRGAFQQHPERWQDREAELNREAWMHNTAGDAKAAHHIPPPPPPAYAGTGSNTYAAGGAGAGSAVPVWDQHNQAGYNNWDTPRPSDSSSAPVMRQAHY